MSEDTVESRSVRIPVGDEHVVGDLTIPSSPIGLVIFAHGSGSGRHSPRNQAVARTFQARGMATLLADLLTPAEEAVDRYTAEYRFDIPRLGTRLATLIDWARKHAALGTLPFGLFGASTGAAAALVAAAARPGETAAVVSRGGRPDLAGDALADVTAPTLLLVGSLDREVIQLNRVAMAQMRGEVSLELIEGATHLFEEPGTLDEVSRRAAEWFAATFGPARAPGDRTPAASRVR
jgi:dienelactone hydrolase